jgi:hypothetical protein
MNAEGLRDLLTGGTLEPPYTIITRDGRAYLVSDSRNIWCPPAFPGTVAVSVPGVTIAIIRFEMVDSITCADHEAVTERR